MTYKNTNLFITQNTIFLVKFISNISNITIFNSKLLILTESMIS